MAHSRYYNPNRTGGGTGFRHVGAGDGTAIFYGNEEAHGAGGGSSGDGSSIQYRYWHNSEFVPYEDRKGFQKAILTELYRHFVGQSAPEKSYAELKEGILDKIREKTGKQNVKFVLKIVRIDPNDKTKSFADPIASLADFLPDSRRRFLNDALAHLHDLRGQPSEERTRLAEALRKADRDGLLDEAHQSRLEELGERQASQGSSAGRSARQDPLRQRRYAAARA